MVGTLSPDGQHFTLDRPLVELAVFDVRYASEVEAPSLETGFALRKELEGAKGSKGWRVDDAEMHELVLEVGPKGAQAKESSARGVRLIHSGGDVEIAVFAGATTVQVQRYKRWSVSLRPFIEAALIAVETVIKPVSRSRVGLRYVNTLTDRTATSNTGWATRIEPSLVASLTEGPFASHLVGSQQQLQLVFEGGMEATLRHGLLQLPSSGSGYLIDWDVYDNSSELFGATDVLDCAESLNREAATLFKKSLTHEFIAELGMRDTQTREETE